MELRNLLTAGIRSCMINGLTMRLMESLLYQTHLIVPRFIKDYKCCRNSFNLDFLEPNFQNKCIPI